jgi:flagellar biogenesis protein FliO
VNITTLCRPAFARLAVLVSGGALPISPLWAEESIPWKESGPELASSLPQVMLWLGILMAVAFVVLIIYKKRLVQSGVVPEKTGASIRVLDRRSVSTRTTVHLLVVEDERWLLCESPSGSQLVRASDAAAVSSSGTVSIS